nr:TnpV protein [uncultured Blautia sp.]
MCHRKKWHKQVLYNELILSGRLFEHLYEIDATANSRLELLMEQYLEIDPALDKRTNQMGWCSI